MHKGSSPTTPRARATLSATARRPVSWRNLGFWALGFVIVLVAAAWVDGGEEPIHPIIERASMPHEAGE